jgi:putative sugar O-methyltransferase
MLLKYYNYLWRKFSFKKNNFDSLTYKFIVDKFISDGQFKASGADTDDYPWLSWEKVIFDDLSSERINSPFQSLAINISMVKSTITILDYIKLLLLFSRHKKKSLQLLRINEGKTGIPKVPTIYGLYSVNNLHHIQHLVKYYEVTGHTFTDHSSYVEFGGGYGNFCRLIKSINKNSTYIIVDLPALLGVQYWYLSSILDANEIVVCRRDITLGKINLVSSIDFLSGQILNIPLASSFISTWALSETPKEIQTNNIVQSTVNQAPHLLMAYAKKENEFNLPSALYDSLKKSTDIIGVNGYHEYLFK